MSNIIKLKGCDPGSLTGYLKSLGIFKIISEQVNSEARFHWEHNTPVITIPEGDFSEQDLIKFFINEYRPTPIVIPWSGKDFFGVNRGGDSGPFKEPQTESGIVESFLASSTDRLQRYRRTINTTLDIIEEQGLNKDSISGGSSENKRLKAEFMARLRSNLPDEMVEVLDVAALISSNRVFTNTLLGSGGGNDGRLHFGGNYMQCLWLVLPDFENQRDLGGNYKGFDSEVSCQKSIFNGVVKGKVAIAGDTPGLFHPGNVGGPNAFEGFEADALRNPWDFIFTMEGVMLFAGALSRRSGVQGASVNRKRASFPFTVQISYGGVPSLTENEWSNRELWLPMWSKPSRLSALRTVFSEGRAEVSGRQAANGVEFARAIAGLGVDRGFSGFRRYGIIKGRVGGKNYHTGVQIDKMRAQNRLIKHIQLLDELDSWLSGLRRACSDESTSKRYGTHLRNIEDAIFDYCKYGDSRHLQEVLIALGKAERSFATAGKGRSGEGRPARPLNSMSPKWIPACYDGSSEYRIACALASIYDKDIGPLRFQLEPVGLKKGKLRWVEDRKSTVWSQANLSKNLSNILQRRVMEGMQENADFIPIRGSMSADLKDVHEFITGRLDDQKIIDLLWGLSTVKWQQFSREDHGISYSGEHVPNLSRFYALVKLLHLPGNIRYENGRWRLVHNPDEGVNVSPEPGLLRLMKRGDADKATKEAVHRLKVSGLQPKGTNRGEAALDFSVSSLERVSAALLIPVWEIDKLGKSVLQPPAREKEKKKERS